MSRSIVVEADGTISAIVTGDPRQFALQASPGQSVFALGEDDDGGFIDDRIVCVTDAGELALKPGAVGDPPPAYDLYLIAP